MPSLPGSLRGIAQILHRCFSLVHVLALGREAQGKTLHQRRRRSRCRLCVSERRSVSCCRNIPLPPQVDSVFVSPRLRGDVYGIVNKAL